MTLKLEGYKAYVPNDNIVTINIGKLQEPKHREIYREVESNNRNPPREKWNNIVSTCIKATEKVLGKKTKPKRLKVKRLSQQNKLQDDIKASKSKIKRHELSKERNKTLKEIHEILANEEN